MLILADVDEYSFGNAAMTTFIYEFLSNLFIRASRIDGLLVSQSKASTSNRNNKVAQIKLRKVPSIL